MKIRPGIVAVVTGAASGIGQALANCLSQRGCDLALVDIEEAPLIETAHRVMTPGRRVSTHVVDVADRKAMALLPLAVLEQHPAIHLLINNAGVALSGPFAKSNLDDFDWIVGINFWGVVHGCKSFLPHLRRASPAHIVNVCSDFGLVGFPSKSAYCATKFAVRGFTESLRIELHNSNIEVTCVYPGPVDTGLIRSSRAADAHHRALEADFVAARGVSGDFVAKRIIRGVERRKHRVLIGRETRVIDFLTRLSPVLTSELIARFQRRIPFL